MKKLRVLFVTPDPGMGGSSQSLLQLMLELREKYNVTPIVLIPKHKGVTRNLAHYCCDKGISCYTSKFYYFKTSKSIKEVIKYCLNLLFYYPLIIYKLRHEKIDIVHSNSSVIDVGLGISLVKHTKHVWHLREFGDLDFSLYPVFGYWYERFIYKHCNCFIAISKCIKQYYSAIIPEQNIKLVYNGVLCKSSNLDSRHNNKELQFVMVGSIKSTKNQIEALKAINIIRLWGYNNMKLNFVGSGDKKYKLELQRYIRNHNLSENVKFWGECDNVAQILSQMDVGLMLSKCEAFGRVTVEYMLQNLLVIAADSGANEEIVTDGHTGYIYHLGDCYGSATTMRKCIDNKEDLIQIAAAGKKHAIQYFSSTENTRLIYAIYQEEISHKLSNNRIGSEYY